MKNAIKLKAIQKIAGIIAIVAVIGFSIAACGSDGNNTGGGNTARYEDFRGNWLSVDPSNRSNFNVFTFDGNTFGYSEFYNGNRGISRMGTFTFTATELTLIPAEANTWERYTQTYTFEGIDLRLSREGLFTRQPSLTEFVTLTHADSVGQRWNPTRSFSVNDNLNVGLKGNNFSRNISNFVVTFKRGNTVIFVDDSRPFAANNGDTFEYFLGYWPLTAEYGVTAGTYTVEIYVVDGEGFKSNTMSTDFEVR